MSLDQLKAAYDRAAAYVQAVEQALPGESDAASFWREIFTDGKRRNYPSFDEMLVMRRGFTYPLADRAKVGETDVERAYAESAYAVVQPSLPGDWFDRVHESAVGAPISFEVGGHMLTGGGAVNALTAYRITESGLPQRPLRVLEIGAGYGQVATQLSQVLDIESYTFVDLVENLFLTAYYLQANFPERSVQFVGPEGDEPSGAQLTFLATPFVDRLSGPFDLVINSYSFQEMDLSSVERYFALAQRTLAPDGVFYSLNSHGKAGVETPTDYPLAGFRLARMAPVRRFPWQVFATVPYELVLRLDDGAEPDAGLLSRYDGLARAMQLGLHDELEPLCERIASPDKRLDSLAEALAPGDAESKRAASGRLDQPLRDYLDGTLAFAEGDLERARPAFESAAAALPATHARARSELGVAAAAGYAGEDDERAARVEAASAVAPHLRDEFQRLSTDPWAVQAMLASQLDLTGWEALSQPGLVRQARAKLTRRARF